MLEKRPIATSPLREHVYERLQELLISRTLAPGDHLVEERLASRLGVSRGPVREALQRLHRDGWITIRPRYGAFVNQPTAQQVHEFFEAREDDATLRMLAEHHAQVPFHRAVLESARNHLLLEFGEQLSHRSRWFFAPLVSSIAPRAWLEHRRVAELVAAGDADRAAEAMHDHISLSRDSYLHIHPDGDTYEGLVPGTSPSSPALGSGR